MIYRLLLTEARGNKTSLTANFFTGVEVIPHKNTFGSHTESDDCESKKRFSDDKGPLSENEKSRISTTLISQKRGTSKYRDFFRTMTSDDYRCRAAILFVSHSLWGCLIANHFPANAEANIALALIDPCFRNDRLLIVSHIITTSKLLTKHVLIAVRP